VLVHAPAPCHARQRRVPIGPEQHAAGQASSHADRSAVCPNRIAARRQRPKLPGGNRGGTSENWSARLLERAAIRQGEL